METTHQTIGRILTALETLTQEEEYLFESGLYVESTAVQQRAMPLVHKIAELLVGPNVAQTLDADLQKRLQKLLTDRKAHYERLSARLVETQQELDKIAAAQARAKKFAPVYAAEPTAVPAQKHLAAFAAEG